MHNLRAFRIVSVVSVPAAVSPMSAKGFLLTRPFQSIDPCDCHIRTGSHTAGTPYSRRRSVSWDGSPRRPSKGAAALVGLLVMVGLEAHVVHVRQSWRQWKQWAVGSLPLGEVPSFDLCGAPGESSPSRECGLGCRWRQASAFSACESPQVRCISQRFF